MNFLKKAIWGAAAVLASLTVSQEAKATIVQFETSLGNFEVNLYDQGTPETVANFLSYVNSGAYENIIIHRSVPGFVIQGGGFAYNSSWPVTAITTQPAVTNEPVYSNVRGTIAMAKLSGDPNSATSQWFFNLSNNSENLDRTNSGFTVFGEVTGNGMGIIDQIAGLDRYNFSSTSAALGELPLQNYTQGNNPDDTNLIIINRVTIIDANTDTATGLNPPANIGPAPDTTTSSSGSGAAAFLLLLAFGLI
ncbi:MAG: peptidylprolyl isomerase [Kangiellaceae bacterium]|nr:peptidylprolyl isomerase [Kangiellaceae bacterium]